MQFSFRKPHFWHSQNFAKTLFGTMWNYLCFQKYPQNTIKMGKTVKKNLDQFLTLNLDQFLTVKPPNLGPAFNFTAYIYIYINGLNPVRTLHVGHVIFPQFYCKQWAREKGPQNVHTWMFWLPSGSIFFTYRQKGKCFVCQVQRPKKLGSELV